MAAIEKVFRQSARRLRGRICPQFPNHRILEPRSPQQRAQVAGCVHHSPGHQVILRRLDLHLEPAGGILHEENPARPAAGYGALDSGEAQQAASHRMLPQVPNLPERR